MVNRGVWVAVLVTVVAGCGSDVSGEPSAAPHGTATSTTRTSSVPPTRTPHILVYMITGDGSVESVSYLAEGQTVQETDIALPWRKSLSLPSGQGPQEWRLTVQRRSGSVQVVVTLDGQVVTQGAGSGSGGGPLNFEGGIGN